MTEIKTIFLPFNNIQPTELVIDMALLVADRFGSYIEGVHYRQPLPIVAGEGITLPGDYLASFEAEGRMQAETASVRFRELLECRGIPLGSLGDRTNTPRGGWRQMVEVESFTLGEYARLFDLSIIERHGSEKAINWKTTFETILFDSGRPILICANHTPEILGRRVVIAWNGSSEAARSISSAMPFLENSEEIMVLSVNGGMESGPDNIQVTQHLAERGLLSESRTVESGSDSVGKVILQFATEWNCDLLIKGAYTRSRLRQLVFGGPTREILDNSSIPTLFCH